MKEHTALQFDWEDVDGSTVLDVIGLNPLQMTDGSISWASVAICLDHKAVVLTVDPDNDQIFVYHQQLPQNAEWTRIQVLAEARGHPLGWCWVGINYRGYKDSFSVAFGELGQGALTPRFIFVAAASMLQCFGIMPLSEL